MTKIISVLEKVSEILSKVVYIASIVDEILKTYLSLYILTAAPMGGVLRKMV